MPRVYTMRQGSYFRPREWAWLQKAVLDTNVQEWLAKKDYTNARALLVEGFRCDFTSPPPGETEAAFKKRRRTAKKSRKENIIRIPTETEEEFNTRMLKLPDRIGNWLANWRHQRVASGGKRWQAPPVIPPATRKPRTITPFDAFCKRGPAPKGSEFVDKRCNLGELRNARKAAWEKLSPEEQDEYRTIAIALMVEAERTSEIDTEDTDDHPLEVVAHAEDIAAHVDGVIHDLHESVGWGGIAIVGGPDENGEGRIHITGVGRNRHGETFLDVLLKTMGWTSLEFDTLFSLWVEQCREGPQPGSNGAFAETARRAMDYVRAQAPGSASSTPAYSAAVSLASDAMAHWAKLPTPVFRFPVCNYDEQDEFSRQQHVMFNALQDLSLSMSARAEQPTAVITPYTTNIPFTSRQDLVVEAADLDSSDPHDEPPPLEIDGDALAPDFPPPDPLPRLRENMNMFPTALINYDLMCVDVNCRAVVDRSERTVSPRPECLRMMGDAANVEGEIGPFEQSPSAIGEALPSSQAGGPSVIDSVVSATGSRATRNVTEPSGIPMPGALGAPVVYRPMRARSTKSRQDTADGTLPLTASKRG